MANDKVQQQTAKRIARINSLVVEAMEIEDEYARQAGATGFLARALVQATLPHRKQKGNEFTRVNGAYTLSLLSPEKIGLPYGSLPRLLIAWMTTEAVLTKEPRLVLGDRLGDFMRALELVPTGGRWGTVGRLKDQMRRTFACSASCTYEKGDRWSLTSVKIIDDVDLWWDPQRPDQAALWESTLTLGQKFFTEVTEHPIPVSMRALRTLRQSPMALDIYAWLSYRMSYLNRPTVIPWEVLEVQFGAGYTRTRDFKSGFLEHLKDVLILYPRARAEAFPQGLELQPSPTHVPKVLPRLGSE